VSTFQIRRTVHNARLYGCTECSRAAVKLRLHDTTGCQPVVQPVLKQAVSCKWGFIELEKAGALILRSSNPLF